MLLEPHQIPCHQADVPSFQLVCMVAASSSLLPSATENSLGPNGSSLTRSFYIYSLDWLLVPALACLPHFPSPEHTFSKTHLNSFPASRAHDLRYCLFLFELWPPKRHVQVLTLSTCECDLTWIWGLCKCQQVKKRPYWIRMGPNLMTCILVRGET